MSDEYGVCPDGFPWLQQSKKLRFDFSNLEIGRLLGSKGTEKPFYWFNHASFKIERIRNA